MKDISDIIPESEKEIFKAEKIDPEEIKTNLDNQIDRIIKRTIDRRVR